MLGHKKILEIDHIQINDKLDEMRDFIQISRTFSFKVHSHLKILVHLVNNLIESDDYLELVDTTLKMPILPSSSSNPKTYTPKI